MNKIKSKTGFSIVEIIVAVGIFAIVSAGVVILYLGSLGANLRDTETFQAEMYLQEGMEAARAIRDYNFGNLTNGTHGLTASNDYWEFLGSSDNLGQFTRTTLVESIQRDAGCNVVSSGGIVDAKSKSVTVSVSWDFESGNPTSISATEYYSDTSGTQGCADSSCFYINISNAYLAGADKKLEGMTVTNSCSRSIVLDKLLPSWTNIQLVEEVKLNNTWVWRDNSEGTPDGKQTSGVELDLDDSFLAAGGSYAINHIGFDGSMTGASFTFLFKAGDGTAKYVEVVPGTPPADNTAPSAITSLALTNPTLNSVDLSWTAPGDDLNSGQAASYDLRYSTAFIDESNWNSATQAVGEPLPSMAGTSESMTVNGLSSGTTYYFAIKTADEVPNISAISNVPNITTVSSEANSLNVISTAVGLANGNLDVIGIDIENTGASTITVTDMTISWTGGASGNKVKEISMGGSSLWTGTGNSGVSIDITDLPMTAGQTYDIDFLSFSKSMSGSTISLTFTMLDGSTKTVSNIQP